MNRLEIPHSQCHKHDRPKPNKPHELLFRKPTRHVTQIVGIVCSEGIVVASESQYTTGTRKLLNAVKLSTLKFKDHGSIAQNWGRALIAEAGSMTHSSLAVRYMNDIAKDREINDSEDVVAKIAQEAVTKVRREILDTMQERGYSPGEQDDIFSSQDNDFALMIAYYYFPPDIQTNLKQKPIPHLYTIWLHKPIAEPQTPFAVLGAAPELAMFVLKQFSCETLLWGEASCLAVDVLERINNDDITCGGPIKLGTVNPMVESQSVAYIHEDELVGRVLKKLEPVKKRNNERQRKELGAVMKKIHQEDFKKLTETLKYEFKGHEKAVNETIANMKENRKSK
jgi:20S proteasome alpha/beta subunit